MELKTHTHDRASRPLENIFARFYKLCFSVGILVGSVATVVASPNCDDPAFSTMVNCEAIELDTLEIVAGGGMPASPNITAPPAPSLPPTPVIVAPTPPAPVVSEGSYKNSPKYLERKCMMKQESKYRKCLYDASIYRSRYVTQQCGPVMVVPVPNIHPHCIEVSTVTYQKHVEECEFLYSMNKLRCL